LYLQLICLAALFFLARGGYDKASAVPQGALAIVLIAFTAFFHIIMNNSYGPLIDYLPLTLAEQELNFAGDANNRHETEEALMDNASASSMDMAMQEKQRDRGASLSSGKARATNVEDVERGSVDEAGAAGADGGTVDSSIPGVDEEAGPKDFYHPASVEPQQTIWMPHDPLGLAEAEEQANRARGIKVSIADAQMDDKGHVDISGAPPDHKAVW